MPTISSGNTIAGAYGPPLRFAGTPVSGASGTHRGAPIGKECVDTTTGKVYVNTGTQISPTWTVVGTQT